MKEGDSTLWPGNHTSVFLHDSDYLRLTSQMKSMGFNFGNSGNTLGIIIELGEHGVFVPVNSDHYYGWQGPESYNKKRY